MNNFFKALLGAPDMLILFVITAAFSVAAGVFIVKAESTMRQIELESIKAKTELNKRTSEFNRMRQELIRGHEFTTISAWEASL